MRNKNIDYLKGFLLFLVVWGHSYRGETGFFWLIFRFHMPLFLMISGYLFNNNRKFSDFIKHKFYSILVPYTIYFLLSYIAAMVLFDPPTIIDSLKAYFLNGKYLMVVVNWPIWYLPFFFLISLIFYPISKIKNDKLLIGITILSLFLTVPTYKFLNSVFIDEFIPWSVQVIPAGIGYMTIGYLYKKYKNIINISFNKKAIIYFISFMIGIVISLCTTKSQILRISTYRYIATSLLMSPFIILISSNNHNKIIEYVGKNSLIILGIHSFIIHFLKLYGFYEFFQTRNLSSESIYLLTSLTVIFIVCIFNEINLFFKSKLKKSI